MTTPSKHKSYPERILTKIYARSFAKTINKSV